jgi:G3E family GTPase
MRFIVVGGFLGAGKTTTIARLAKTYEQQGLSVAIVTNDQGSDLVDTLRLRASGFHVGEVPGACFCGNIDTLLSTVDQLGIAFRPDVMLIEPIGSCTDLVATVIHPLAARLECALSIAPYCVILKPRHGLRVLSNEPGGGVSPKASYIFRKQIEEADVLVVNRIDELEPAELDQLVELLRTAYPGRELVLASARTGQGFDLLNAVLARTDGISRRKVQVDYALYAAGEAELGWMNASLLVTAETPFRLNALVTGIVHRAQAALVEAGAEIAHLKAIGMYAGIVAAANCVGNEAMPDLPLATEHEVLQAELVINARVAIAPPALEAAIQRAIEGTCREQGATYQTLQSQCFRPGGPMPSYRIA